MPSALVLGGAACVWEDAEAALGMFSPDLTVAVNDALGGWPGRVDHFVTLHREKAHVWQEVRRGRGLNDDYVSWGHDQPVAEGTEVLARIDRTARDWRGSSGLFAVRVCLRELGCDRVVLAGVPMTREGAHFFDGRPWDQVTGFVEAWRERKEEIAPFVRSMSGWTAGLLGVPTPGWLASGGQL